MGFKEDLSIMQEWLNSAIFGNNGDERKFLQNLCQISIERADQPEADRVIPRKEIAGPEFRTHLDGKAWDKAVKDTADRAMNFYQHGVASYQKMAADHGKDTILVPMMKQGKGGPNMTCFYLATTPFDAEKMNQIAPSIESNEIIIYERNEPSEVKLSWWGKIRFGSGTLHYGGWRRRLFAYSIAIQTIFFSITSMAILLSLNYSHKPLTGSNLSSIVIIAMLAMLTWYFQFIPINTMIQRKMILVDDLYLPWDASPAQLEKVADPHNADVSIFRIVRYQAVCAICGSDVEIQDGGKAWPDRFVGGCRNSPQEHVYSFDRFTLRGKLLREVP